MYEKWIYKRRIIRLSVILRIFSTAGYKAEVVSESIIRSDFVFRRGMTEIRMISTAKTGVVAVSEFIEYLRREMSFSQ